MRCHADGAFTQAKPSRSSCTCRAWVDQVGRGCGVEPAKLLDLARQRQVYTGEQIGQMFVSTTYLDHYGYVLPRLLPRLGHLSCDWTNLQYFEF